MHMALDQGCRPDRHEISEKAQRLFAERGYDRVSMSEVAGAVGLSFEELRRMVPNKDALVLKDMPVWRALKAAFSERIALFSEERMRLWRSAVLTAPPELQQLVSLGVIERAALISMVAERMDVDPKDDPRPSVMVTEVISTVAQAYEIWLYDESSRPLMELINESLDQLPD
jgi:hypothetical protein